MNKHMTSVAETEELLSVRLSRVLPAPRERAFEAWTSAELIPQWWGPKGYKGLSAEADPRPGGAFAIQIEGPDDEVHLMRGVYAELSPPELICMEVRHRQFEGAAERPEGYIPTQVRVELREHDFGTELTLIHTGFVDAAIAARFDGGWSSSFDKLESALARCPVPRRGVIPTCVDITGKTGVRLSASWN